MGSKRSEIEEMIQIKKTVGVLKIAAKVFWWGATVLVALLIVSIIGAKVKGEIPYFCGYSVMNIISGSMEDKIPSGTYILIKKTDASEIKKGDIVGVVRYYINGTEVGNIPITVAEDVEKMDFATMFSKIWKCITNVF